VVPSADIGEIAVLETFARGRTVYRATADASQAEGQ
jgi:hypothetical protein